MATSKRTAPKRTPARRAPPVTPRGAASLAPLETLRDAVAWAASHGPNDRAALDTLLDAPKLRAAQRAARIHALATVGGPHALRAIASYAADPIGAWPNAVTTELVAAWDRYDRRAFARTVFARTTSLHLQPASFLGSLAGVEAAPKLTDLRAAVAGTCSLEPIAHCARLRSLLLNLHDGVDDLTPVARCATLRMLEVWNSARVAEPQWASLAALPELAGLRLTLGANVPFAFLAQLKKLFTLTLAAERATLPPEDLEVLIELLRRRRRLEVFAYEHERWTDGLESRLPAGIAVHRSAGMLSIARE